MRAVTISTPTTADHLNAKGNEGYEVIFFATATDPLQSAKNTNGHRSSMAVKFFRTRIMP